MSVLTFHTESVESVAFSEVEMEGGRLGEKKVLGKGGKVFLWVIY